MCPKSSDLSYYQTEKCLQDVHCVKTQSTKLKKVSEQLQIFYVFFTYAVKKLQLLTKKKI